LIYNLRAASRYLAQTLIITRLKTEKLINEKSQSFVKLSLISAVINLDNFENSKDFVGFMLSEVLVSGVREHAASKISRSRKTKI
jgi:hypothetical protein